MQVLLVDDVPSTARAAVKALRDAGYDVELAPRMASSTKATVCVCRSALLEASPFRMPVVLLCDDDDDVVSQMRRGPKDFVMISRPSWPRELVLRIEYLRAKSSQPLRDGGLVVDKVQRRVTLDERALNLTRTELDLLIALLENAGNVTAFERRASVKTHVARLKQKLGPRSRSIVAERGLGYRWVR